MLKKLMIGAVLLAATGCSSTSEAPPPSATDAAEAGLGVQARSVQQVGRPFAYQETFSDGTSPVDWEVTVTGISCGLTVLKNAADNPEYTSGTWSSDNVPPERIDARPPAGKEFCRMDATMKNTGRTPATSTESFGNLDTDRGEFAASYEEDMSLSANLLAMDKAPNGPFNPGDTARVVKVWTVPVGAVPAAVLFPSNTLYDSSVFRVEVD
ncbi:hypothetical protein [Actinoplanes sp. NPDC051859]|uniref:hypothetical protein n=1 Tax=Actinoplanes sp. NPDC051859 TaxID=3363909 RepID=UPI0037BC03B1